MYLRPTCSYICYVGLRCLLGWFKIRAGRWQKEILGGKNQKTTWHESSRKVPLLEEFFNLRKIINHNWRIANVGLFSKSAGYKAIHMCYLYSFLIAKRNFKCWWETKCLGRWWQLFWNKIWLLTSLYYLIQIAFSIYINNDNAKLMYLYVCVFYKILTVDGSDFKISLS